MAVSLLSDLVITAKWRSQRRRLAGFNIVAFDVCRFVAPWAGRTFVVPQ